MSELHADVPTVVTVGEFARALRPRLESVTERVVEAIGETVPAEVDAVTRQRAVETTRGALTAFAESLVGPSRTGPKVDEQFRRLGAVLAGRDTELQAVRRALHLGLREALIDVHAAAVAYGIDAAGVAHVSQAAFVFTEHLNTQLDIGRDAGLARTRVGPRQALLEALLGGRADVEAAAERAGWPLPAKLVVMATGGPSNRPAPTELQPVPPSILARRDASIVVHDPADEQVALDFASRAAPDEPVAISWPVDVADVPAAVRWTRRALDLAERGVIAASPVLRCDDHRTAIWLHGEPAVRTQATRELLRPLLEETPNSREILAETLLAWLECRDSAAVIAARLSVHPQTVRYRWKRINQLFGDALHDPEFIVEVTMLLKASVPLWKSGDQSDFEPT